MAIPVAERDEEKYITLNKNGEPMCPKNFSRRHHKRMMEKYGYDFKPHELRKWFGSYNISRGVPIAKVSRWMGHKNPKVTMESYLKEIEDMQDLVSYEADNIFSNY